MTNEEMYKTVDERQSTFNEYCNSRSCVNCKHLNNLNNNKNCALAWLADEAQQCQNLKPCPFCGESRYVVVGLYRRTLLRRFLRRLGMLIHGKRYLCDTYEAWCCQCNARGGWAFTKADAAINWNRRSK